MENSHFLLRFFFNSGLTQKETTPSTKKSKRKYRLAVGPNEGCAESVKVAVGPEKVSVELEKVAVGRLLVVNVYGEIAKGASGLLTSSYFSFIFFDIDFLYQMSGQYF